MINLVLKYMGVCDNDFFQPPNYYQMNAFMLRLRYSHDLFIKDCGYFIGIYRKLQKKKVTKADI